MAEETPATPDQKVPDEKKAQLEGLDVQNGPPPKEGEAPKKGSVLDREAGRVDDLKEKGQ